LKRRKLQSKKRQRLIEKEAAADQKRGSGQLKQEAVADRKRRQRPIEKEEAAD